MVVRAFLGAALARYMLQPCMAGCAFVTDSERVREEIQAPHFERTNCDPSLAEHAAVALTCSIGGLHFKRESADPHRQEALALSKCRLGAENLACFGAVCALLAQRSLPSANAGKAEAGALSEGLAAASKTVGTSR